MSYYTYFKFKIKLRKDTPLEVIHILCNSIDNIDDMTYKKVNHSFFDQKRWMTLFHKNAFFEEEGYPCLKVFPHSGNYELKLIGEINNGYDEINLFCDWISPYVMGHKKKRFLGESKGEEQKTCINHYAIYDSISKSYSYKY